MRITKLSIFFILILFILYGGIYLRTNGMITENAVKENYDTILKSAVEDASNAMIIPSKNGQHFQIDQGYEISKKELIPNLDKALNQFYKTLYINLGIETNKPLQEAFKMYVPIKLVVAYKGIYVNTLTEINEAGKKNKYELWHPINNFNFMDITNNLIINFTLDDYVYITNLNTMQFTEGKRTEMLIKFPTCTALKENKFEDVRRKVITDTINGALSYYSTKNNNIAKKNGFQYNVQIPILSNSSDNAVDNISFIAFYQGLPIRSDIVHNSYAIAATKIRESKKYYGSYINGVKQYHKEKICTEAQGKLKIFENKVDAAKEGYLPCMICN